MTFYEDMEQLRAAWGTFWEAFWDSLRPLRTPPAPRPDPPRPLGGRDVSLRRSAAEAGSRIGCGVCGASFAKVPSVEIVWTGALCRVCVPCLEEVLDLGEALRQIDALHRQDGAGGYCVVDGFCVGCGQVWPCPTNEIIAATRLTPEETE